MKKILVTSLGASLILSLMLHLTGLLALQFDWHLREQLLGLKQALAQIIEEVDRATTITEKVKTLTQKTQQEVSQMVDHLQKGEPIRFGPDNPAWQELAQKIKQEQADQAKQAKEKGLPGADQNFGGFAAPPLEVELVETPPQPPPEPSDKDTSSPVEFKNNCTQPGMKSYGGIGLEFKPKDIAPGTNLSTRPIQYEVKIVAPGYPAAQAGIKPGDIIEGNPLQYRGTEGSPVQVVVFRQGQRVVYNLTRTKICYFEKTVAQPKSSINQDLEDVFK